MRIFGMCGLFLLAQMSVISQVGSGMPGAGDELWELRNAGKAFYENPTTQVEAVEIFERALRQNPSTRERLNYGLALLRAGRNEDAVRELLAVQKAAPELPHTYFNLGVYYKKDGQPGAAIQQLERMAELVPDEPVTRYNLGVLYKGEGRMEEAIAAFEKAVALQPAFAAPHFQLYNAYRAAGKRDEAARELVAFQELRKFQEERGDAVPKEDMDWSDYAEIYDPLDMTAEDVVNRPQLKFTLQKWGAGQGLSHAVAANLDGDGRVYVALWGERAGLYRANGTLVRDMSKEKIRWITAADLDNDGKQELIIIDDLGLRVGHSGSDKRVSSGDFQVALTVDYDHDYDLDLLLFGDKPILLRNEGPAGWRAVEGGFPFVRGRATGGAVFKAVSDTKGIDVLVTYADRCGVLYRDRLTAKFEPQDLCLIPAGAESVRAEDWNHDNSVDLVFLKEGVIGSVKNARGMFARGPEVRGDRVAVGDFGRTGLFDWVAGRKLFDPRTTKEAGEVPVSPLLVEDLNGDGRMDLLGVTPEGDLAAALNQTTTPNGWFRVELRGVKNLISAPYAEVEIRAGTVYQKRTYRGLPLTFGLRGKKVIDTVRITWPNSLIQNEMKQTARRTAVYKEAQRLSGSCPMIFTWNGSRFEFVTDVLGVAPLGAMSGDGEYFPTDRDEYVQIQGHQLVEDGGVYRLRITEELGEVSYLDELSLLAVDHPAEVEVYSSERWKSPPYPEFRLFGIKKRIYPVRAVDDKGRDVLDRVVRRDQRYVDGFERTMANTAARHYVELDFGDAARDGRAVVVVNGWVDWADGSTFLNKAQGGQDPITPPWLEMEDGQGRWVRVIDDFGMPSGKTKTFAVDLSGKWISDSRKIRIVTNMCVFWDEIFLGEDPSAPEVRIQEPRLRQAELRFHGFSKSTVHPERKLPEFFEYEPVTWTSYWNPTPGMYTKYGWVEELVREEDDRLVVMGAGDEVRLEFEAGGSVPEGWVRDFQLRVGGWAKDSDANTAFGQQVGPLPYRGMKGYPHEEKREEPWMKEWLTRPALRLLRPL
jgi:tetratricopeptide (TPR) repeat protein